MVFFPTEVMTVSAIKMDVSGRCHLALRGNSTTLHFPCSCDGSLLGRKFVGSYTLIEEDDDDD